MVSASLNQADFADFTVSRMADTPETGSVRGEALRWTGSGYHLDKWNVQQKADNNSDGKDELYLAAQDLNNGTGGAKFHDVPSSQPTTEFTSIPTQTASHVHKIHVHDSLLP